MKRIFVLSGLVLLGLPQVALAYIGPGAGLSAIGSLLALVGAILLAVVGFIWYPAKKFLKKRKAGADASAEK